jgi:hypothetical protein
MELATDDQLLAAADRDGASFTAFYLRYERAMLAFFLAAPTTRNWPPT